MERTSYTSLLQSLAALDEWLQSMAIPAKRDRIHAHIANIETLDKAFQKGDVEAYVKRLSVDRHREITWSLIEAKEFADAYIALEGCAPETLADRVKRALDGPVDPVDETGNNNRGRNLMFELSLGSSLIQAGCSVEFRENPDILCKLSGAEFYIQCKRPMRDHAIRSNFRGAGSQLRRDLETNEGRDADATGVVAISLSRVINDGRSLLVGRLEVLLDHVDKIGKQFCPSVDSLKHDRIAGCVLHALTPLLIDPESALTFAQGTVTRLSRNSPKRHALRSLMDTVGLKLSSG